MLVSWGDGGTTTQRTTPVQVSGLTGVTAIAVGAYHSLALKSDGTVRAWGYNEYGQLGNGMAGTMGDYPEQVSGLTGVTAVACGLYHSLALMLDRYGACVGTEYCYSVGRRDNYE